MTAAAAFDPVADGRPAPPRPSAVPDEPAGPPSASDRLRAIAVTAIDRLAAAAATKVDEMADRLGDMAADAVQGNLPGGVGGNAALRAGLAALQGKNPVWAGIKGAVGAMSTTTKILLGLALILVAVLSPVAILVLALVLIVAGIVGAVRS
ncbi:hypothetical protein [Actinomycetospora flava]|uniref:Superfamily III holin-X n=1 Tax=Actinomycetospora flava TaxID=3129232 RepID=A0ABU8M5A9_9PSEU